MKLAAKCGWSGLRDRALEQPYCDTAESIFSSVNNSIRDRLPPKNMDDNSSATEGLQWRGAGH